MWYVDGAELGFAGGGGVIDRDGGKGRAAEALFEWTQDQIHLGAFDLKARIEVMDDSGIFAQVCFPNSIGLGGQGISDIVKDPELRLLCVQIYNDAMAEVQAESGGRLLPMPVLPAWDVDAAVAEAKRVAALDLRGVNITSDPNDVGGPDLASRAWDPLWEVCADLQLPVHFHIGASLTTMTYFGTYPWESQDEDTKLAIGGTLLFIGNARVVTNIILSGMLDRHPALQDGLRRERRGLGSLHPRGARLRDVRERAEAARGHGDAPVGVLQAEPLRHLLVREEQPARPHRLGRGGQHALRDGLPAPDLPLPQAARHGGREDGDPEPRGAAQDPGRERAEAVSALRIRNVSGCRPDTSPPAKPPGIFTAAGDLTEARSDPRNSG